MRPDRFKKIGIQRELHVEWFDYAARVCLAGFTKQSVRQEIYTYLDNAPGFETPPSLQTKTYIAHALIKSWLTPDKDLISLRDSALRLMQKDLNAKFALHWCLLGAAYPFWFAVAAVIGRLLNLQNQVTQMQIVSRLKERWGDRQTVSRRARYVIRSFVAWGVLKDSEVPGCYERSASIRIDSPELAIFMILSMLHAKIDGKCELSLLLCNPSLFPFKLPALTGDFIAQHEEKIENIRYGLDDDLLKLKSE